MEVLKAVNFNVEINLLNNVPSRDALLSYAKNGPPSVSETLPWTHLLPFSQNRTVQINRLDWTENNNKIQYEVDWILGADIVYERSLIREN